MKQLFALLALVAGATTSPTLPANAAESYKAEYVISAIGLRVGKTSFTTTVSDRGYTVKGSMQASGIASLFSSMSGNLDVQGARSKKDVRASSYDVSYKEGKRAKSTKVTFKGNNVAKAVNKPKRPKRTNWVDHPAGALNNVVDPITALLIPAQNKAQVCARTVRVFDGVMRADIKLSYLRTTPFSVDGFKGEAVTCRAQFIPVSGYQTSKKDVAYMRDRGNIEIGFAPMGKTGLYAPVIAKADTRIGEIAARITSFKAAN